MSTTFWNFLKLSPALLGSSLLVDGSAYSQESIPKQKQIAEVRDSQVTATLEPIAALSTQLPSTQVETTSVPQVTPANASPSNQAGNPLAQQVPTAGKTVVSQLTPANASPSNQSDSSIAQQVPAAGNIGTGSTEVLDQIQRYSESGGESQDQVTNVTQLTDVRPTDWAYEALRSLVERYGCIVGYPDRTYRGNRSLSRYEFAAGLNACLNQIERLIASSTADFVRKSDLETLQRLVQEFRTELTAIGARVDKLEGRVGFLEDHQFSTTTKLNGEVIFALSNLWGERAGSQLGTPEYQNTETVFQDRVRLNFDTSFTGKDLLRTRLQAANVTEFGPLRSDQTGNPPGTNITREGRFGFQADNGNSVELDRFFYRFPFGNIAQVYLFANNARHYDYVPTLNPNFESSGTGALSRFGRFSPIYRMGGSSQGVGVTIGGTSPIRISAGYLTDSGANPAEKFGLFDGNYTALGQVTFQPFKALSLAATYVHNYDRTSLRHGTGSIASQIQTGRPVVGNSYGVEASFAFTPQLVLSGWGSYTNAIVIGTGTADVWQYGATLAINDFGTKGSTLGFVVGMEPKLTGSDVLVGDRLPGGRRRDPDTGLHIEGFYKFKLTNNILITPGVIWLTAPGHNDANDDIFIGTVRTTFTF